MDYDNNEFEAHSHKLSGEECSKVSSVLHPYALPKFDFDDNLQNHLRFDTLVENEVFLGILSQEDNHWIEDFSRGSSGIEFNSSAAESCSVSRCNNVWFEATSSESVEMLLKSIGQEEEAALGEAVIEESDAVIKVGTLEKEMDPILNKQDEVVDNTLPQHELLPYSVTDNLEDSALPEHANALCTSEPQSDGFCNSLCSAEVESNVDVVLVNAEKLKDDLKSGDAKGVIDENLTNKSPTENMKEASSVSAVHMEILKIENANSVSHNAIVNSGELEKQVITVFAESVDALPTGNIAGNEVEVSITTSEVPSGTPIKVGDHSNMLVDFEDNLSAAARHTKLLNCSPCEDAPVVCSSDNNPNEKVVEVSNTQAVASACPELDMGYVEEKDCGSQAVSMESPNVGNPNSQIESSLCEVSPVVCSNEYKPNEKVVEVSNTQAVASDCPELELGSVEEKDLGSLVVNLEVQNIGIHSSETETSSCPDLKMDLAVENDSFAGSSHQMGSHVLAEATVSGDNDPGYTQHTGITEDVGVDLSSLSTPLTSGEREQPLDGNMTPEGCRSPPTLGKSVNPKEKDVASEEIVHTCEQVVTINERLNGGSQTESVDMECKVIGLLPSDKCREAMMIEPHGSDFRDTKEQAKEFTFNVQTAPEVGVMSMDTDKSYVAETEGHDNTGLRGRKESLPVETCLNPVNVDGEGRSDQAAAEAGTECSEKQEVCSVSVDSTVKQVDGTAAAEFKKGKEIPMEKIAETSLKEVPGAMEVSKAELCLVQRQEDLDSVAAFEKQNVPGTKDDDQAPGALACTSVYGSDSMVEDCGHPLNVKETTIDSFQHIELSGAVGTDMSVPLNSEIEATGGQSSFSFDVFPSNSPSKGQISKDCQSFPSIQVSKGPLLTSNSDQADLKTATEFSCITPQAPGVGKVDVSVKGTPEPKTRRASGKASVRSAKKGSNLKEATPGRQSDKKEKSPSFMQTPRTGQPGQFKELKPCGDVTKSGTKPLAFLPIPTSNLPDLNTSVPTAAGFQQPFTDLQQVQLRAQIFVYGSLIQESAPDEACMISAFGPSDGGGDVWGSAWRACVERAHARKSSASNMGTPVQSFSGGKAPIQPFKHSILQNKPLPSPAGRASSELISSPAVTPIIPLSSPLWNVSTPSCDGLQSSGMLRGGLVDCYQPHSPLHPFQVPGTRNFVWHSPSWPSQGPFSSSWMATSQTSASDANVRFSVFPNTEPVKLTPAKYSSVPSFPAMKIASVPVPNDSCVATVSTGASSQPSVSNPRKRKNSPASEAVGNIPLLGLNQGASVWHPSVNNQLTSVPEIVGQTLLLPQSRTDSVQTAAISAVFSTSVAVTAPDHFNFGNSSGNILGNQPNRVGKNVERSCIPVQISSTVEEAKLHAETAAAHAANAVGHYHDFWSELDKQKNLGVISDVEAKLASSAAAITAATSVARAAAAAAMIASNVAVQAKLMADEVSSSGVIVDPTHSNSSSKATSAGGERREGSVHPSSIIAVAREAAKKRVEAASAASKHAENLDAIVKAAELAAEAVSQAGKILSVGGTLPLSALKEIVPAASEQGANKHIVNCDQPKAFSIELFNFSAEESKRGSSAMEAMKTGKLPSQEKESSKAQRGGRESKLTKTHVIAEAEAGSRCVSGFADAASAANAAESLIENVMEEGCLVEVFKDCGNGKAAWYSANILSLKDGKAFLSYTDLQAEDGTGQLKEWVPLQSDSISMPTVRVAHPTTTMRFFDGTRRKRKAAVMEYSWSVGDRVDAWLQDCWREGVVKEKNKNDETTLTIDFPALGDTSVVRVWHLRPTLTWKDGKWIEWSSPKQQSPSQVDGPREKRARLASPTEAKGKEKFLRGLDPLESRKLEDSRLLPICENEKEFNVGKSTVLANKQESRRIARTGLKKEGSRVVFGVPTPGKKRKFMDVSKHIDSDKSSTIMKTDDPVKYARNVAPQVSGFRGWKSSTKDNKDKQAAEDKPKVLRSGKPPSASNRTLPRKDNILTSNRSMPRDASATDRTSGDAISNEETCTSQENLMEFGSVSDSQDTSEGQTLASSLGFPRVPSKKGSSSNSRSERRNKGKYVPHAGRNSKKDELEEKLVHEVVEPRRSNRKIQPTSRLLEGLQSSLSIPKMPFSHDKSYRSQSRSKS